MLLHSKENNQQRWKSTEEEKVSVNHISHKGLISKIHKELQLISQKLPYNPVKKWSNDLNRHSSTEDIKMAKRYMKGAQHHYSSGKCKSKR